MYDGDGGDGGNAGDGWDGGRGGTDGGRARTGAGSPGAGHPGAGGGGRETRNRTWSVDEHLTDILRRLAPPAPVALPLLDAQGCVLAEDVLVAASLPPFDNSSMDGYAVRTADVAGATGAAPVRLTVVGDIAAGSAELPAVGPGRAARIMTGAPLPPGADAVVPVEWTDGGTGGGPATAMAAHSAAPGGATGEVRVYRPAGPGAHVRRAGSDATAGSLALPAGTVLGPAQLGLLAAVGRGTAPVRPRPRVLVISTGSELVPPGEPLGPGRIHDSNSFALTAAARDAGAAARRIGAVTDDAGALRAVLEERAAHADAIITSGGVSVGAYDVVKEALAEAVDFRRLAMQPGKPQGFGLLGPARTPLFALPGNPVSAYVSFELFVRPALRTLMGLHPVHRPVVRARLAADGPLTSPRGKRQFLRGTYRRPADGGAGQGSGHGAGAGAGGGTALGEVTPVGGAGSHLMAALARADALIVVPEEAVSVAPGAELDVIPLG